MHRTLILDIVGLAPEMLGDATPRLRAFAERGGGVRSLRTITPAVTCSAQATLTTGLLPREHGCVANGWYVRDLAEILFWRQSNHLVHGEKIWEAARARDPSFTCAKLFWWYNMYSTADISVTPRPIYWADGLKIPDIYTEPAELREELIGHLGEFPLFRFWGPSADIRSSRWIAACARHVQETRRPTLTLVYLPHLDYGLQRLGPNDPLLRRDLLEIDAVGGELIDHALHHGARVIVLSEYGITPVTGAIAINRALREAGLLRVRMERGLEKLDPGASEAFAVVDHQIAHVYVRRPDRVFEVRQQLERIEGVDSILDSEGKRRVGLDHDRSGELVLIAKSDRWFSYYYWLDDRRAPEFARTVDIHRKPGYDPLELFLDPSLAFPRARVALTLAKKMLGLRYLMSVIPLDPSLVKGSHGRVTDDPAKGPLFISSEPHLLDPGGIHATDVKGLVLRHVFE